MIDISNISESFSDNSEKLSSSPLFKMVYRLCEDLQRVQLSHENRIRQILPALSYTIKPPRKAFSWEEYFAQSADVLLSEKERVLRLAEQLLKLDDLGKWMLAQKGIGPSLGVSILGEIMPIGGGCIPLPNAGPTDKPFLHTETCRFINVQKLWAYAGLHVLPDGTAPRKKKGEKAPWNWRLKTRLWVFASVILKTSVRRINNQKVRVGGTWYNVYIQRKEYEYTKYNLPWPPPEVEEGIEAVVYPPIVDPITGVVTIVPRSIVLHNRSIRYMEKMLLKDIWRVAHNQPPLCGIINPTLER